LEDQVINVKERGCGDVDLLNKKVLQGHEDAVKSGIPLNLRTFRRNPLYPSWE